MQYPFYKQKEISEYIKDYLHDNETYIKANLDRHYDIHALHNEIFNTDYYMYGYNDCQIWLGYHAFECIGIIKDYEQDNFGEVITDLTNVEKVVNMYVYIVGEELLYKMEDELVKKGLVHNV
tara:strand:+ start:4850 stop:5215 length:366 start_codon:yes stop_codon:yes gene_type:complete